MADLFCDSEMEEFQVKACGIDFAGIIALGLIHPDMVFTPEDLKSSTWWEAALAASPQMVYLIKNTRGEVPVGSITTAEGFGKADLQVTGAARTATVEYEGMKENYAATEGANRREWIFVFFTMGDLMYVTNEEGTFFATPVIGRDKKLGAFYQAQLTWQDFSNPVVLDSAPII